MQGPVTQEPQLTHESFLGSTGSLSEAPGGSATMQAEVMKVCFPIKSMVYVKVDV